MTLPPNREMIAPANTREVVAKQMQKGHHPKVLDLSSAITEIEIETTIQGASILTLHLMDPDWQLLTSGFIAVDEDGLLQAIDVNLPVGTDCWWRLAACNPSSDLGAANLIMTFEDRIVSQLRNLSGPKSSGAGQTRASFIAGLVREVSGLRFVAPTLKHPEPGTAIPTAAPAGVAAGGVAGAGSTAPASPARANPSKGPGITPAGRASANVVHSATQDIQGALGSVISLLGGSESGVVF